MPHAPPLVIRTIAEMRREVHLSRVHERRVGLVPTMGYLHEGHVSLLRAAREVCDVVVLSIFVNPTQFGPKEDLSRYPRDLAGDLEKAREAGCDLAFAPDASEMYPNGYQTYVDVREVSRGLCGEFRPGHFTGVASVVLKLLNIVQPQAAFFGEKDFQQLMVLRRMARDLDVPTQIVGLPLVREPDGVAMSSRNAYLSPVERTQARALSRALFTARDLHAGGERGAAVLLGAARAVLLAEPAVRLQYLELRDADTLVAIDGGVAGRAVMALAAYVGATRLLDNVLLG